MARESDITRRDESNLARPESSRRPFGMERFADEMDRLFDDFGLHRAWMAPRLGRSWLSSSGPRGNWAWAPDVEIFHRNNELVIRADLPGLSRDDVKVEVTEDHLTIQGERKQEHEETREGFYRSERSYGSFFRNVPLPPGTMSDQAKATFKDGVLEIRMPSAVESTRRSRRLEISEGAAKTR
jgi:HSP20 family protein